MTGEKFYTTSQQQGSGGVYLSIYVFTSCTNLPDWILFPHPTLLHLFYVLVPKVGLVPKYTSFFSLEARFFGPFFLHFLQSFFQNNKLYFSIASHSQSFTYVLPTYLLWRRGHKFNVEIQHFLLPSSLYKEQLLAISQCLSRQVVRSWRLKNLFWLELLHQLLSSFSSL